MLVQLSDDWNPCHDWDILIWEALEKAAKDKGQPPPENRSMLAALGFLTLGNQFNGRRDDIIGDQIDVTTKAFLVRLEAEVVAQRGLVAMWEAGPSPIRIPSYRRGGEDTIIHKGEPRYESELSNKISKAKSALNSINVPIEKLKFVKGTEYQLSR